MVSQGRRYRTCCIRIRGPSLVPSETPSIQYESLAEFVIGTLCETSKTDPANINLETSLDDVGFDSVSLTAVLLGVEMKYGCEFSSKQIMDFFQADLIKDFVSRLMQASPSNR